ncbi:MAG: rhomboid family intramembrane serine protease [Deltaproteobacteria bacterium]|nr:rhomboid family intramembrane serine protease [Deltaproteobacteria bacterium]
MRNREIVAEVDFEHRQDAHQAAPPPLPSPWVTRALLLTVFAMYGVQLMTAAESPLVRSIELGANYAPLVFDGQWDRLITANWMHAQGAPLAFLHILMNSIGLLLLGRAMEMLLGPGRFFVIYVVSAIAGAVTSSYANQGVPSLGASTGVVGLFAAIGYILFRFRAELPTPMRKAWRQWVLLLLLNIGLWIAFTDVGIDHYGHGGGFLAGAVVTVVLTAGWPPFARRRTPERVVDGLAVALAMVVVAGLAVSLGRYSRAADGDYSLSRRIFRTAPMGAPATPILLNDAAWTIAIDPDAGPVDLNAALDAAERAVAHYPADEPEGLAAVTDTQATLLYRVGRYAEAIAVERGAFESSARADYGSQLTRFLAARLETDGPIRIGAAPALSLGYSVPSLTMNLEGEAPNGLVFYAVARHEGRLLGLVRGALPADTAPPSRHGLGDPFPAGTTFEVALIDANQDPTPVGGFGLTRADLSATIREYP